MSDSDRPSSLSGSKRAASPANAVAEEAPAQRMRLSSSIAAAADPASAVRPPLSAAQRCATDALLIVFGFIEWKDLFSAAQTSRAWYSAAAKEKPRRRTFCHSKRLAALCISSSPFKRHIEHVDCGHSSSLSLNQLAQLRQLPELIALQVQLSAEALTRLMQTPKEGGGALAELKAAFPPNLRQLALFVSKRHSTAACQLLVDALPAMERLEELSLWPADDEVPGQSESLSLEPLLQLPRLTHLKWQLGDLTVPQLLIIKQNATLQHFIPGEFQWTVAHLAAFCRPPHRLQRLEEVELSETLVDAAAMTELARLPALTAIESSWLWPDAYAHLPRLPRLQRLRVTIMGGSVEAEQEIATLVQALSDCPTLTDLTLKLGICTESFGDQLVQAVPQLRSLRFEVCSVPSLRFLRHAHQLEELSLAACKEVRLGHVIGIRAFAPQLRRLRLTHCDGLLLDEAEQQLLTPPGALGLPHLHVFEYVSLT